MPVAVTTDETTGFRVTVEQLEAARTPATKVLLFVSPSNPTGAVYPRDEIEAIGRWALDKGLWVVTDEIYEHLVYGGAEHHSMPVVVPELADRCVVVNGVAKTYAMTGWRVGWMIGPPDVDRAPPPTSSRHDDLERVQRLPAGRAGRGHRRPRGGGRDARRLRPPPPDDPPMLNEIDGVACVEPEGAFYAFPSVEGLLGRELGGRIGPPRAPSWPSSAIDEAKVAVVPGEAFGAPGYFRMSYALGDDDLVEGVTRLATLFAEAQD